MKIKDEIKLLENIIKGLIDYLCNAYGILEKSKLPDSRKLNILLSAISEFSQISISIIANSVSEYDNEFSHKEFFDMYLSELQKSLYEKLH